MPVPTETLVYLRVRERRFYGTWKRLQNLILPSILFRKTPGDFVIRVNHILLNGIPNRFPAVQFSKRTIFLLHTDDNMNSKAVIGFEAATAELCDGHINVLVSALTGHAGCRECQRSGPKSFYRL